MKVLVTGASGFVGHRLCQRLIEVEGLEVVAAVRQRIGFENLGYCFVPIGDLSESTDWTQALVGVNSVVHTAARVHVLRDKHTDPHKEYRRVNVDGTVQLARQAIAAGVKRFVYLSSIKVNGDVTALGCPFTAEDAPNPSDSYGVSKYEAEQLLRQIAGDAGMDLVIIRPPIVYGPGVKANFASLINWLSRDLPLPLASVTSNRRSFLALDNLVDLIATCLVHRNAVNQTFLVSDGEDLSTVQLLNRLAISMGRPARLFHVSPALLRFAASVVDQPHLYQRLCCSLQLDVIKTQKLLGWKPAIDVDEGLRRATLQWRKL